MDTQKDNQKDIDNKNVFDIKNPFGMEFLRKKIEKISSATYLITNFIAKDDPIRHNLRQTSLEVIDSLDNLAITKEKVRELISLMEVAKNSGQMSEMNFNIMIGELASIFNGIQSQNQIEKDNLEVSMPALPKKTEDKRQEAFSETKRQETPKRHSSIKDIKDIKDTRKGQIVDMLKNKPGSSIKDIAGEIKDCSEKTIQRDLLDLIDADIVKKEGERRWSKYFLVN